MIHQKLLALDQLMAQNKRQKEIDICIPEGSRSSRNLGRSVEKNNVYSRFNGLLGVFHKIAGSVTFSLTNVQYLGNQKSSNTEEMAHNVQLATSSPPLKQIQSAFHLPENGEMIHPLMTDRTEVNFSDGAQKFSIQQESKSTGEHFHGGIA